MAMHFLKKTACGTAVSLCLLSIGNTSMSFDHQPASTIHNEEMDIVGMEATDLLGGLLISPSAARPEKIECLTPVKVPRPTPSKARKVTAGWYGPGHQNKRTANGQRFNMHKNTLAHRTLPFGTRIRLVNPENGKSAEGVVNDRGPYRRGRDLDVSYAMAKQLGFVKNGTVTLYMEKIWVSVETCQTNQNAPI
jgi:peptidoglycan lytic transglycosylase